MTVSAPSTVEEAPRLGYRGENLAACLNSLRLRRKDAFERLVDRLRGFLPNLEGIVVHRAVGGGVTFSFSFRDFVQPVPAFLLSDGTRSSLAYLVISVLAQPPLILCLEEPENGYHPKRLRELMDIFVELAYPAGDAEPVQVLVSTHSPYLLDFFSGEMEKCIRIVEMSKGRSTVSEWLDRKAQLTPAQLEGAEEIPVGDLWAQGLYGGV
jgi:predicted ATPase